jgi:hypothetical protein
VDVARPSDSSAVLAFHIAATGFQHSRAPAAVFGGDLILTMFASDYVLPLKMKLTRPKFRLKIA